MSTETQIINPENEWPILTNKERDRRWSRVRKMMQELGLQCIVVFDLQSREQLGKYLTNDVGGGIVVFPKEGELVQLVRNYFNVSGNMLGQLRGDSVWSRDVRAPALSDSVIEVLQEKGLERANVGVVGLNSQQAGSLEGQVPYPAWHNILAKLPHVNFMEISVEYCKLMLVKSEEELQLLRRASQIAEQASKTMLEVTRPGVSENVIYAEVVKQLVLHGANTSSDVYTSPIELHSGPNNSTWGPPMWLVRGQKPRVVQKGDIVTSEIFTTYGSLEAQVQMCIGIEPLDSVSKECALLARKAYEAGVKALLPGRRFTADVNRDMEAVFKDTKAYHLTPLIHSLNPLIWVGTVATNVFENLPGMSNYKKLKLEPAHKASGDLIIEPNMTFELETNASIGNHRVNIGGCVIVKENGTEELNTLATKMQIIN
jgi:Xaa-Pro dipeptidase